VQSWQCDNYNLKSHKYVRITTHQPDTKFNPNPNPKLNLTTKQHAIVNIDCELRFFLNVTFLLCVRLSHE